MHFRVAMFFITCLMTVSPVLAVAAQPYLSASASSGGTIEPAGKTLIPQGGSVMVTVTPKEGYDIAKVIKDRVEQAVVSPQLWSESVADDGLSHKISAKFVKKTYAVTLTAGAGGRILPQRTTVTHFTKNLRFTINPDKGYEIEKVYLNGEDKGIATSVKVDVVTGPVEVSAIFRKIPASAPGTPYGELTRKYYALLVGNGFGYQELSYDKATLRPTYAHYRYNSTSAAWEQPSTGPSAPSSRLFLTSSGWEALPTGEPVSIAFSDDGGATLTHTQTGRSETMAFLTKDIAKKPLSLVMRSALPFETTLPAGSLALRQTLTASTDQYYLDLWNTVTADTAAAELIPETYPADGEKWLTLGGLKLQFAAGTTSGNLVIGWAMGVEPDTFTSALPVSGTWELRQLEGGKVLLVNLPESLKTVNYLGWEPPGTVLIAATDNKLYAGEMRPEGTPLTMPGTYVNSIAFKAFMKAFKPSGTLPPSKRSYAPGTMYKWFNENYPIWEFELNFDATGFPSGGYLDFHAMPDGTPCTYSGDNACQGAGVFLDLVSRNGSILTFEGSFGFVFTATVEGRTISGSWTAPEMGGKGDFFASYTFIPPSFW